MSEKNVLVGDVIDTLENERETLQRQFDELAASKQRELDAALDAITLERQRSDQYAQMWVKAVNRITELEQEKQQRLNVAYWIFRGYAVAGWVAAHVPFIGRSMAQAACDYVSGLMWKQLLLEGGREYARRKQGG